jgi:4-diphosphocytidyl-2-C-methyl-D-erythritol kinase
VALILPAYAKLNLTLDVLDRRPDGYHEIDSVMQTISLHDLLWVERTDCRVFDVVGRAIEGENLVLKAARELEGACSRQLPFTIRLYKRIPIGAGMGGGSADAAAFLMAANLLYGLKLKTAELAEIGAGVGQDVPFFLRGGTARATGLGSTLAQLPAIPQEWRFVVVCPPIEVSTRTVYQAFDENARSAHRTNRLVEALNTPSTALATGGRESAISDETHFGNDLQPVTSRLFPEFEQTFARLDAVLPGLTMTGTGSALFACFKNAAGASAAAERLRPLGYQAWVCHPVPAS